NLSILIDLHEEGLGLDVALMAEWNTESVFQNQIGLPESLIDIALFPNHAIAYIGDIFNHDIFGCAVIGGSVIMQYGRAWLHCIQRMKTRRQLFVFDFNKTDGFLRRVESLGRNRGNFVADVTDLVPAKDGDVAYAFAHVVVGFVLASDNRLDTCNLPGLRWIDIDDAGVSVGAA